MVVNSFKELMLKALNPRDHYLRMDDVRYLDGTDNQHLKDIGAVDLSKIAKLSVSDLIKAYQEVAVVFKGNSKKLSGERPESYRAYLNFFAKIERELGRRKVPRDVILGLFREYNRRVW